MRSTLKGVPVPDVGDDLLASYEAGFNAAGIVVPVASVAAARTILAEAEASRSPAAAVHPFYFDVNGVLYRAAGDKGGDGAYRLQAVNEVEAYTNQAESAIEGTWTVGVGAWKVLVNATVPSKPYNRLCLVAGTAWCRILRGSLDLEIYFSRIARNTTFKAHVSGQDDDNTSVTAVGLIPAGAQPDISMWFKSVKDATQANNKVAEFQLTADEWTRMTVMLWPVSMG